MPEIYDDKGAAIADFPLSERQLAQLERGAEIVMLYHTPQMLRALLGSRNGSFTLRKLPAQGIVTKEPKAVREYADLQQAIIAARSD